MKHNSIVDTYFEYGGDYDLIFMFQIVLWDPPLYRCKSRSFSR